MNSYWVHIVSGGGPAVVALRNNIELREITERGNNRKNEYRVFIHRLKIFLNSRTDTRRLIYAQQIAEIILHIHDIHELVIVRKNVAELELTRIVRYEKHRDHTTHTLYSFLLGIWLYDNVSIIRNSFKKNLELEQKTNLSEEYAAIS
jgi:hypothetical protein